MNRGAWLLLCFLILAIISGVAIAAWRIAGLEHSASFQTYGSWRGATNLPLNKNDLVTTQVTLFALFALPSQEAVYLFAASDNTGNRLNASSPYTVDGNINTIKAEYWSITAYGQDLYLMPDKQSRYSFNKDNLQADSAGNFKIVLSDSYAPGNWLPVQKDRKFELVLRIYHGDADFMNHLEQAELPAIKRQ